MQMAQDKNFLVSRNDVFVLVVVFDSSVLLVKVLALKNLTINENVNLFLSIVYQYSKVFLIFNIDMRDLMYK